MTHCASRREDLPAAPPGSPLALPLIYSLIHLRCCHMASLVLPPRSPSVLLLISQSCSSRGLSIRVCPCILPSLPSTFPFPSPPLLSASLLCCNRAPLPPSPLLQQFTPKVSADPILPLSAIDVPLWLAQGSSVMQTRPMVGACGRRQFLFINQQPF